MKRFIFHFCSLIILLSTTAVQTSASDFSSNGMEYNILSEEERTVEFARLNDYDGDLSIPEQITHNGTTYTVTAIRKFAFYGSSLTSIEIPETVTVIGEAAFGGCSNLTSITINTQFRNYARRDDVRILFEPHLHNTTQHHNHNRESYVRLLHELAFRDNSKFGNNNRESGFLRMQQTGIG